MYFFYMIQKYVLSKKNYQLFKKHSYITPEFQLLLCVIKIILLKTSIPLPTNNYDESKLLQLIKRNNLSAFIAAHIHLFQELEKIKPSITQLSKINLSKNLLLQADLLKVIDLTTENNLYLVLFKGHPVNEMIYGNNNGRTSTDIDIMLPPEELQLLENILFEKEYIIDRPSFEMNEKEFKLFLKIDNKKSYFSPNKSKLDVHFKLFKNPYLIALPKEEEKYLLRTTFFNRNIYRMNNQYTLLYLMVDGKIHYWEKMMWLIDIVKLMEKMSENELSASYDLAKKNKLDHLFIATISLCNVVFESPIPPPFENKITSKHAEYIMLALKSLSGKNNSKLSKWKQRVSMKPDLKYFLYQISLFPTRDINIVRIPFAKRILYPLFRPITHLFS